VPLHVLQPPHKPLVQVRLLVCVSERQAPVGFVAMYIFRLWLEVPPDATLPQPAVQVAAA